MKTKKIIQLITIFTILLSGVTHGVIAQETETSDIESTQQLEEIINQTEQTDDEQADVDGVEINEAAQEVEEIDNQIEQTTDEQVGDVALEVNQDDLQSTNRMNRALVTYPATIESIFPDPVLAQWVADQLKVQVTSMVVNSDFDKIQGIYMGTDQLTNLSGLEELSKLTSISIYGSSVTDISNVDWSKLPLLKYFTLSDGKLDNLTQVDLSKLSQVESFVLSGNPLGDNIKSIDWTGCTSLQSLDLGQTGLTTLEGVNWVGLDNLQSLNLIGNPITNLSGANWTNLSSLTSLIFAQCEISELDSANWQGLTNLQQLHIDSNKLTDISGANWVGLENVISLNLAGNEIVNINSNWVGLDKLEMLMLMRNKISDLTGVNWSGLTSLRMLGLEFNELTSIKSNWTGMPVLNHITFIQNKITDISDVDFSGLPSVQFISIEMQDVILDKEVYSNPLVLDNVLVGYNGEIPNFGYISEGGTFDSTTGKITWNSLQDTVTQVQFQWYQSQFIDGKQIGFGGFATIPLGTGYLLTFKDYDGTVLYQKERAEGATVTAPTTSPRPGYTFAGWTPVLDPLMPNQDTVYVATYTKDATPQDVIPETHTTQVIGRTCQDDGYPSGYWWNGNSCVIETQYVVPNTGVK